MTIAFMNRAKAMIRQGIDVQNFTAGEPDFDTPIAIKKAAIEALNAGQTKYMPTFGDPETRAVIARKFTQENGLPGVTGDHVAVSAGGKHALYVICQCLLDAPAAGEPAQEVLLPVPSWVSYGPLAEIAGGRVVELPTTLEGGFKITPGQLRKAIGPRSRMLILNSPSNPCGTMYSEAELRAIGAVVAEAAGTVAPGLVVVSDEIYEKIVYGGVPHFSIGSMPEIAERTITVNGLSKAYSMTGWRVGYTAASGEFGLRFMRSMAAMQGQMTTNITSFVYPAIRTALTGCEDEVEQMRLAFAARAGVIAERLGRIEGMKMPRPVGAFYAFPDVSKWFGRMTAGGRKVETSTQFCEALLEEAHVAFVPGEDFGGVAKNHVRISFACPERQIHEGMDRLEKFVRGMR
ncbi:MAG: pyridoxal phosphate-dependent aminotransferase [Phycisphaerales bacterium]|nr:pyridoxal phosphate-dependent aminotransferase [Phycisphaerales bacterium]